MEGRAKQLDGEGGGREVWANVVSGKVKQIQLVEDHINGKQFELVVQESNGNLEKVQIPIGGLVEVESDMDAFKDVSIIYAFLRVYSYNPAIDLGSFKFRTVIHFVDGPRAGRTFETFPRD